MAAIKRYTVDVNGTKETIQTYTVAAGAGAKGEVLRFKLPAGAKVELTDDQSHQGPKGLRAKRVNDDLHLALPGSELARPDIVIEGYYARPADAPTQLIGKGSDGAYHAYTVDGLPEGAPASPTLASTSTTPWGLVSGPVEPVVATDAVATAAPTVAAVPAAGPSMPAWGWGLGGLALVGVAAGGGGGGGGEGGGSSPDTRPIRSVEASGPAQIDEGGNAVFNVTLRNPGNTATTWSFKLDGGTAGSADVDPNRISFTNGVTYDAVAGTITIPPNVAGFTVTVQTVDDNAIEAPEQLQLEVGGTTGFVTLADNDVQKVATVVATNGAAIGEGGVLSYTVTLNGPSGGPQTYAVSLKGQGGSPIDPATDITELRFSEGVSYDAQAGTLTVGPGIETFTVDIVTADDAAKERAEGLSFSVGGVAGAAGTITDNDTQLVTAVNLTGGAAVNEGAAIVYQVTLSGPSAQAEVHALSFLGSTVAADRGAPTFTNGVTYNAAAGTINVPAGVTAFQITVPTVDDRFHESDETLTAKVDDRSGATVTVRDNDPIPTVTLSGPATHGEGDGNVVTYTAQLSNPTGTAVTVNYAVTGGTATAGQDFTAASGTLRFAPGETTQTVRVTVADDTLIEAAETYMVGLSAPNGATLGAAASVTTTLKDNDQQTVLGVGVTPASVIEGGALVFTVNLSAASPFVESHAFALGGSASAADLGAASFSHGVTLAGGKLSVPIGVTNFTVTVPTVNDTLVEANETVTVSVGGQSASATLGSDDVNQTVGGVSVAAAINEGSDAVFTVTLSVASPNPTNYAYTLGGTTVAADRGAVAFSDGVTLAGGQVRVPAGVRSFTVTVPTVDDTAVEGTETIVLTVGGQSASTNVRDNDVTQNVTGVTVSPAAVVEGGDLVYTVTLNAPSPTATSYAYTLGGSAVAADREALVLSDSVSAAGGRLNIPAGVRNFSVTVGTVDDSLVESTETVTLTVDGNAATGSITDNDVLQSVTGVTVSPASVAEGGNLVYTVTLNAPSPTATSYAYTLGGTAAAADREALLLSDGVTVVGGRLNVPAGVRNFSVTIGTVDDGLVESTETLTLTVGGSAATGNITDNDVAQTVTDVSVSPAAVVEGGSLVYTVTLNASSPTGNSYAYTLGGSAVAADRENIVLSHGVTAAGGVLNIPAGIKNFTVTVGTVDDAIVEPTETVTLTVDGNAATGSITDNDPVDITATVATVARSPASVVEGGDLTLTVTLSDTTTHVQNFALGIAGDASAADFDLAAASSGTTGVSLSGSSVRVAAGVSSFTLSLPTVLDALNETDELATVSVGGTAAPAVTLVDATPAPPPPPPPPPPAPAPAPGPAPAPSPASPSAFSKGLDDALIDTTTLVAWVRPEKTVLPASTLAAWDTVAGPSALLLHAADGSPSIAWVEGPPAPTPAPAPAAASPVDLAASTGTRSDDLLSGTQAGLSGLL